MKKLLLWLSDPHFIFRKMGFLGAGNNPMVGMTVSVAVAVEEAMK